MSAEVDRLEDALEDARHALNLARYRCPALQALEELVQALEAYKAANLAWPFDKGGVA